MMKELAEAIKFRLVFLFEGLNLRVGSNKIVRSREVRIYPWLRLFKKHTFPPKKLRS